MEIIKESLRRHGVICVKGTKLSEQNMIDLASSLGDEVVILPPELSFNNKDLRYPPISRVGNILMDGSLKDSMKEATIWHQDGDFWDPADAYIFNLLHSVERPQTGGQTWFLDLVKTLQYLREERSQLYEKMKRMYVLVETKDIPDFKPLLKQGVQLSSSLHKMIHLSPFTQREVLFLGASIFKIYEQAEGIETKGIQEGVAQDLEETQVS